jgi:hypothetical protein
VTAGVSLGFRSSLQQTGTARFSALAVWDFNNDGIQDVVAANSLTADITIFLGNGDGSFRLSQTIPINSNAVVVGDFNGDGKPDLASINGYGVFTVLLGNGDGTFASPVQYGAGTAYRNIVIADFNNDGFADLAVTDGGANSVDVFFGNGDGTFTAPTTYQLSAYPNSLAAGDFNSDGNTDLVVATETGITTLLGKGGGTFAAPADDPVGACGVIVVRDLNGDGSPDIVGVTYTGLPQLQVMLSNGDGTFSAPLFFSMPGDDYLSLAVEDFNGDGIPDVATADRQGLAISLGNGDGSFQPVVHYPVGAFDQFVAVGDFNGDGIADVAVSDQDATGFWVLLGGANPTLTISASRFGGLTQGQVGASYNVVVRNSGVVGSAGTIRVNASIPAGFNLTVLSGSGWLCNTATVSCSRSDPLAAGASYPAITLLFNISSTLAGTVTSNFSVSGGSSPSAQTSDSVFIRSSTVTALSCSPNPATVRPDRNAHRDGDHGRHGNLHLFRRRYAHRIRALVRRARRVQHQSVAFRQPTARRHLRRRCQLRTEHVRHPDRDDRCRAIEVPLVFQQLPDRRRRVLGGYRRFQRRWHSRPRRGRYRLQLGNHLGLSG